MSRLTDCQLGTLTDRRANPDLYELSTDERDALSGRALHRYREMRTARRPVARAEAHAIAKAITRNDAEQKLRRMSHDTGCVAS